jgi:hypothetical protein
MMRRTRPGARRKGSRRRELSASRLDGLIEEATVDAYGESEQTVGFFTMLEEHLAVPFETVVLGMEVTVEKLHLTDDERIVAVCVRNRSRQRIPISDLPIPDPPPEGSEWIEAYRRWTSGGSTR